jgi:hypothetical protein
MYTINTSSILEMYLMRRMRESDSNKDESDSIRTRAIMSRVKVLYDEDDV